MDEIQKVISDFTSGGWESEEIADALFDEGRYDEHLGRTPRLPDNFDYMLGYNFRSER